MYSTFVNHMRTASNLAHKILVLQRHGPALAEERDRLRRRPNSARPQEVVRGEGRGPVASARAVHEAVNALVAVLGEERVRRGEGVRQIAPVESASARSPRGVAATAPWRRDKTLPPHVSSSRSGHRSLARGASWNRTSSVALTMAPTRSISRPSPDSACVWLPRYLR